MAYFIIFLSIAVVLGPLMAVLPTKQQRALANRRDQARAAGVSVTLREPDDIPPRLQRVTDNVLVCYSLRLSPRESRSKVRDLYVRTREGWVSRSGDPVPERVESLPASAEVARVGWDDVRVYWREQGEDEDLQNVIETLRFLRSPEGEISASVSTPETDVP